MYTIYNRKILLLFNLAAIIIGTRAVTAQPKVEQLAMPLAKEIMFTNGKWKDIAAQARKNDKYIFVDAFTTWCGPCRQLKNVTFKDAKAALYFNDNFINYTVDMEKDEGLVLAEKWHVAEYPSLLFFTPQGKLIMKQIGYVDAKKLIEFGEQALAKK